MNSKGSTASNRAIGLRVRGLRHAAGLTRADLAKALYWSEGQVQRTETGQRTISLIDAVQISSLFGVPLTYLAGKTR